MNFVIINLHCNLCEKGTCPQPLPPLITSIVKQQQAGSGASGTPGFKTGFHIKDALFTKILIYDREEGAHFI